MAERKRKYTPRRVRRSRSYAYEFNPFAYSGYSLPPGSRGKLKQIITNDLFWKYVEQLRVIKEKEVAVISYMDAIVRRIARGKNGKA